MRQEQLVELAKIYNSLMQVSTKGEDTFLMANCLKAFLQILLEIQGQMNTEEDK